MDKKRTFVIVLICIGISLVLALGLGGTLYMFFRVIGRSDSQPAREGEVTRYEWMEMLCGQMGLTDHREDDPYFSDVDKGHDCFPYLQSAVEWEILEAGPAFHGEDRASGRFIALTAMKAIGEQKLRICFGLEEDMTEETYIRLALDHELMDEERLDTGATPEECRQILEKLRELYFVEFWKKDLTDAVYREGVVEVPFGDLAWCDEDCSEIAVRGDRAESLKPGTVIVVETKADKIKAARKVTGKGPDGHLLLSPVGPDQVVESLRVSDITQLTFDHIADHYGFVGTRAGGVPGEGQQARENVIPTKVFDTGRYEDKGFKVSLSVAGEDERYGGDGKDGGDQGAETGDAGTKHLEIEFLDHNTGVAFTAPLPDLEIEAEEGFSAEIDVESIVIGVQADLSFMEVDYAEVGVSVQSSVTSAMKLFEKEKKIELFQGAVPVAGGLMSVDVQLFLVLSAEGELSLVVDLPVDLDVRYERGKGLRALPLSMTLEDHPAVEADCEMGASLRIQPILKILELNIIDMALDTGVQAEAKVTSHPDGQICSDISLAFPVMKVTACKDDDSGSLIGKMGFSGEWEIFTPENALFKKGLHHELLPDLTTQFTEECTFGKAETPGETAGESPALPETVNTYHVRYGDLYHVDSPRFSFDHPDGWKVVKEETSQDTRTLFGEQVVLSNDRGVTVTYMQFNGNPGDLGGGGRYIVRYEAVKVADAAFEPYTPETEEERENNWDSDWDLGNMVVARVRQTGVMQLDMDTDLQEVDGGTFYALLPQARLEENGGVLEPYGETGAMETFSFNYLGYYGLVAQAPDGRFTEEEEREVVKILASFREN